MKVTLSVSALQEARWRDYAVRFCFGGLITVATGLLAKAYGPVVGGLFLAFPAILPASLTLVARHERDKKARRGMIGVVRARRAAALDASGAALGSLGLLTFAGVVSQLLPRYSLSITLGLATIVWFLVPFAVWWRLRKA
jgi:Protein of unknown function (DUF3147)